MAKIALAVASALAILCSCTNTRTVTTKDGSASVETKSNGEVASVHITGKDGEKVDFNSGKPITDYPADVPLYAGKSVADIKSDKKHARAVTVQSSDPVTKISDFYKTQLDSKGWKVANTMTTDQMTMFVASKQEQQLVVTISSDGKMQTISQQLADK